VPPQPARATRDQRKRLREVLHQNATALAELSEAEARAFLPVLREASKQVKAQLAGMLEAAPDGGLRWRAFHRTAVAAQLEHAAQGLEQRFRVHLDQATRKAQRAALDNLTDTAAKFSDVFGGTPLTLRIREAQAILSGRSYIIPRVRASAARYGDHVQAIQGALAQSLLAGDTLAETVEKLRRADAKHGRPAGPNLAGIAGTPKQVTDRIAGGIFEHHAWWAERVVRTEWVHAANVTAELGIADAHALDQQIQRRWDATLESRTCPLCIALDGEVVDVGQAFSDGTDRPPRPPNCRCSVIAWRADWNLDRRTGPVTAPGSEAADRLIAEGVRDSDLPDAPVKAQETARSTSSAASVASEITRAAEDLLLEGSSARPASTIEKFSSVTELPLSSEARKEFDKLRQQDPEEADRIFASDEYKAALAAYQANTVLAQALPEARVLSETRIGGSANQVRRVSVEVAGEHREPYFKPAWGEDAWLEPTVAAGGGFSRREAATHEFSREVGLGLVPRTTLVRHPTEGFGSLQDEIVVSGSPARVRDQELVHKAIAFDFIIGNSDRHDENWLPTSGLGGATVPGLIDNGLAFPEQHPSIIRSTEGFVADGKPLYARRAGEETRGFVRGIRPERLARIARESLLPRVAAERALERLEFLKEHPEALDDLLAHGHDKAAASAADKAKNAWGGAIAMAAPVPKITVSAAARERIHAALEEAYGK